MRCKGEISVDERLLPDFSEIWPEWKAVQKVGEGSFGKVFRCVRKEYDIETECAIKVISIPKNESEINAIRAEYASEDSVKAHFKEIVDEFANEIKMMVLLKGAPNIVSVENYKIVEKKDGIGWDIYIQMEYLTTFSEFARKNSFTERAVARLATDICSALEVCEEKNIIHRDIKPDNIFIDNYGNYKIGDFGVARKLEHASIAMSKKGTYTYMAPEVYHSAEYDNRADIYSLGMVMYKLLNRGRDPFTDPYAETVAYHDREAALVNRMRGENLPAPVDASLPMSKIIIKACSYDPKNRFVSPGAFKAALKEYSANAPETGNVPVDSTKGLAHRGENKDFSQSKSVKSVPLFMDDLVHDKSKSIAEKAPVIPDKTEKIQQSRTVRTPYAPPPQNVAFASSQPPVTQPKKKGKGKAIAAIIIVFVLVFAAAGGYFAFKKISENKREEQIKADIKAVGQIRDDFFDLKISYDEASGELKKYLSSDESKVKSKAKNVKADIDDGRDDVENHLNALEHMEDGEYEDALNILNGIGYGYENYDEVDSLIYSAKYEYKEDVIGMLDTYISELDFDSARTELEDLQKYVDDSDVAAAFDKLTAAELEYYKAAQEVYVVDGTVELYTYEYDDCVRFAIRNDTAKTVSTVYLSTLEYDSYGDPVYYYSGTPSNENLLRYTSGISAHTTQSLKDSGEYWSGVYYGTHYAHACVRYVEYTDGTRWDNPYYDLWLEAYQDSYY